MTLMMEAVRASETSAFSKETTRRYIPEGSNLHTRRSENWLMCLPLDPKVAGSNLAKAMDFLRAIKVRRTPSFGWEVKPEVPCRKILRRVKDLLKTHEDG
jgi:hypothetical protein